MTVSKCDMGKRAAVVKVRAKEVPSCDMQSYIRVACGWWSWAEQWAQVVGRVQMAVKGQRARQAVNSTEMLPPGCPDPMRWTH